MSFVGAAHTVYIQANIEPLYWENQLFGINSAIIRFSKNAPILRKQELDIWSLVQAKIFTWQTKYIDILQDFGFQLVEGEIDFVITVEPCEMICAEIAKRTDIPSLQVIASDIFSKSRFRVPWYSSNDNSRFYAQWVKNAVLGTFDNICLVFRDIKGKIKGFVSLRYLGNKEVRVGLLGGYGMGEKLIQTALSWSYQQKSIILRIATNTSNIAAIKCYIKSGARIETISYWLYR